MSQSHSRSETTTMETNVQTIGVAILLQSIVRYGAFVAMTWLSLTFASDWVMAYIARH